MKKVKFFRLFWSLLAAYLIMRMCTYMAGDVKEGEYQNLDEYITTEVIRAEGTVEQYDGNQFGLLGIGDTMIATLKLPEELAIKNAGISFRISNCKVDIYFENEVLFSYGEQQYASGRMIGAVYPRFQVPEKAWGRELRIVCLGAEEAGCSAITGVTMMKAKNMVRYPMVHREMGFMIYMTMFILFCMMGVYFVLNGRYDSFGRQGIYLSLLSMAVSGWILCYTGMYLIFSNNMELYSNIEYLSLFFMPIPFSLYLLEQQRGERWKHRLRVLFILFTAFFVGAVVLNYTQPTMHFTRMVKYFHMLTMYGSITAIHICLSSNKEGKRDKFIVLTGFGISIALFLVDIIIYNVNKFTALQLGTRRYTYSEIGIIILLATMVLGYGIRLVDFTISKREKQRLEKLAYMDNMTMMVNRAGCFEMMKVLDQKQNYLYQVIYFDVDSLKNANDIFGHEVGDQLIMAVAEAIRKCFGKTSFCGRLGGDEFIVISEQKATRQIHKKLGEFETELLNTNEQSRYPFEITVSYGIEQHARDDKRTAEEVIRAADAKMYSKKKLAKQ